MNRLYFIIVTFFFSTVVAFAQTDGGVSIGKNGEPANSKALLELVSTTKGLLIPRMTTDQRTSIFGGIADASAQGLMVYDTRENAFYYWDGTTWKTVASATARVVSGTPTITGVTGDMAFDSQNSILYVYSGGVWVKAGGGSSSTSNGAYLDPKWNSQTLYLGSQDGKIVSIDVTAKNIKVEANSTVGLSETTVQSAIEKLQKADGITVAPTTDISSTNVQSALVELQSDINSLKVSSGLSAVSTDNSTIVGNGTSTSPLRIPNNAINSAQIVNGAVTLSKIFSNNEFNKVLTTDANGTVVWENRTNFSGTSGTIADGSITGSKIATNTITSDKLSLGTATYYGEPLVWTSWGLTYGQIHINAIGATGTKDATTFLRGDGTWATISAGATLPSYTASNANQVLSVNGTGTGVTWSTVTSGGAITLAGQNYLSLSGTTLTANQVDLSGTHVTGLLAPARFPALTGDVTNVAGTVATTIANSAVTNAKIADGAISSSKIANGAVVNAALDKTNIPLSGFGTPAADIAMGGYKITGLAVPTASSDAVTKSYVDAKVPAFAVSDADKVLAVNGSGTATVWTTPSTGGITSVSVTSANGFTGSSSGGTTPALTLGTSVSGLLKGNGTAISAAVAGTDYIAPGASSITIGTGSNAVTLSAPTANTGAYNLVLPTTAGTADYVLKTNGSGVLRWDVDATGAAGSGITSIGLSLPLYTAFTTLTGDGSFTGTLATQSANTVLAGPSSGVAVSPTFRALVATDIPSLDWAKITTGKPTTLAGYGITDAAASSHTHTFASLTSKPTTIAGYGITDALSNPMTTSGDIIYGGSSGAATRLAAGTSGQVLTSNGTSAPTWTTLTALTNPMTTTGDIIYATSGSTPGRLAAGSNGQVLTLAGGVPTWATVSGTGDMLKATYDGASVNEQLVGLTAAQTLTNKTIAAGSNTITGLTNANLSGTAGITDANLATISTAGKVSNSATTATSANTNSAIVARDASGNFTAGTITAALTGNATTATTATNISGGVAGAVLYQSAVGTTAKTAAGTSGQVLTSNGASAPTWTTLTALTNPMTTSGDIIYGGSSGAATRLAAGSNGQVLTLAGGVPTWATVSGTGDMLKATYDGASVNEQLVGLTATQTLTNKTLSSPALTGTPTAPTATAGTNTTQIATTAFVTTAVASAGDITGVTAGSGLSGGGTSGTVTLSLPATGVTANTYASPSSVTVDTYGRVTAITAGSGGGSSIYTADGSITADRTVTQAADVDLTFKNSGTGRTIVDGAMQTKGGVYANIRSHSNASQNITWAADDYIVIITVAMTSYILALPDPTTNAGRIVGLRNASGSTIIPYSNPGIAWPSGMSNLTGGMGVLFISDGSVWHNLR